MCYSGKIQNRDRVLNLYGIGNQIRPKEIH
jgi:hypothetical protein